MEKSKVGCSISQLRLQKLSLQNDSSAGTTHVNGKLKDSDQFSHPCKCCSPSPDQTDHHSFLTSVACKTASSPINMEDKRVSTQCCCREKPNESLCRLNQQASGEEADWLPNRRVKLTTYKDKDTILLVNEQQPSCSQTSTNSAIRDQPSLQAEPSRDGTVNHSIMLPPKKRICMNLELGAAQSEHSTLTLSTEAHIAADLAEPPRFNMGDIKYAGKQHNDDIKYAGKQQNEKYIKYAGGQHRDQEDEQKMAKFVGKTSSSSMPVKDTGSSRNVKASKLLIRRYRLLSEIV